MFAFLVIVSLLFIVSFNDSCSCWLQMGELKKLVEAGKVLSEAHLRRAHAIHSIAALQPEYSLWDRDTEEEIIPLCRFLLIFP